MHRTDAAARTATRCGDIAFAATYADSARIVVWAEIRADIAAMRANRAPAVMDLPLWSKGIPDWGRSAWGALQSGLPTGANWDVWTRWYQERLDGGLRSEAHELVFANVPKKTWDEGPAAANAWIKAHLTKQPEGLSKFPLPLPKLESPFAYAWTAALRVAAVPGAHNLPSYPFFDSEEHHRRALCR